MQTTTTGSCQIELFAGLLPRRKWSRIQPIPCPVCGVDFKPKSGRKYCSLKCSAIQIGRDKQRGPHKWPGETKSARMLAHYHATKHNPEFIVKKRLRNNLNRIGKAVKRNGRTSLTEALLGCSFSFFKSYIEKQFTKGMTWRNYATHWHLDHIVPLSAFDLTRPDQVAIACNWNNIRPLLKSENLSKGAKLTHPQVFLPLIVGGGAKESF